MAITMSTSIESESLSDAGGTLSEKNSGAQHKSGQDEKSVGIASAEIDDLQRVLADPTTDVASDYGVQSIQSNDLELIAAHLNDKPFAEWLSILKEAATEFEDDEMIPESRRQYFLDLAKGPIGDQFVEDWELLVSFEAFLIDQWSIYPEVRVATRPIEEVGEDYENFRTYFLSLMWAMAGCVLDTFFEPRFPAISIGSGAVQMFIAGSGQLWAMMPYMAIPFGRGRKLVINNGKPWSFKEQTLATLGMSVSVGSPYSQDVVIAAANEHFYNFAQAGSFGFTIILTLASGFIGFGFAGLMRSFVVYPVKMVWWSVLPTLTLNRALVAQDVRENVNGWRVTRWEFFWIVFWLNFAYYWITNFVFSALSYFDWTTWIAPNNVDLQALTGVISGLGINPISTLDPNVIGFSSLYTPLSVLNTFLIGYSLSTLVLIGVWYSNASYSAYLPINSNSIYDNEGNPFDVGRILNSNLKLDEDAYQNYSLPYWAAANLVLYGVFFMAYPAMFVYAILYYGQYLWEAYPAFWKSLTSKAGHGLNSFNDRFSRQMKRYKEVPEWWFLIMMLISIGLSIACVEYYSFTNTPVWTIFLALGLNAVFLVPFAMLSARTTNSLGLNVLYELVIGYALPGNGMALMISKTFGYMAGGQADNWVSNQVQSHYCGVAPRALFRIQVLSVICCSFVQSGIITWQASGALGPDFCTAKDRSKFRCVNEQTYFNAGVLWGTIGPKRVFKGLYPKMKWCFLIGALYPIPFYLCRKFLPKLADRYPPESRLHKILKVSWLQSFNEMVCLLSAMNWAPTNWWNLAGNFEIGYFWHLYIKKRYPRWWSKYTYVFLNAVSIGVAIAGLLVFFATEYHHIVIINWWGNNVMSNNGDGNETAVRLEIPERGYFGPERGSFPR